MLEAYDNSGEECLLALPAWISTVCRHREHFANVALVFGEPPLAPMFVLGHASQNPFWVSMLQLRPCRSGSASSTDTDIVVQPRAAHFYSMKVDHSRFYFEDEEHFALPPAQIIPFLTFETKNLAWSDCPAVPYREFVANLPVPAPRAQKPKKDPLALDDEVKERLQPHRRIIGKSSVASVPAAVPDPDASARVEVVEFKDLVQAMADEDLVSDPGDEHDEADFIVRPYRGHNSGRKQSTLDSFRAEARGLQESQWVAQHFPQGSRTFTLSARTHELEDAVALCGAWTSMMKQWFSEWRSTAAGGTAEYTCIDAADLLSTVLVAKLGLLPESHATVERFTFLRRLRPA